MGKEIVVEGLHGVRPYVTETRILGLLACKSILEAVRGQGFGEGKLARTASKCRRLSPEFNSHHRD